MKKKIHNLFSNCPSHPWVALKNLTIHTITQSLTLSNFFYKSSGEFKFGHKIGRVELYEKKIHNLFSNCPSHPWVALKNLTIHTITQSLTLSNFFHKSPGEFKFSINIGRVELYKKNSQPLFHLSLPPLGSPQKFDYSHIHTIFDAVQLFQQVTWRGQIQHQHR